MFTCERTLLNYLLLSSYERKNIGAHWTSTQSTTFSKTPSKQKVICADNELNPGPKKDK